LWDKHAFLSRAFSLPSGIINTPIVYFLDGILAAFATGFRMGIRYWSSLPKLRG
jgi:hypothetical protein